jgi:hypothetical protein
MFRRELAGTRRSVLQHFNTCARVVGVEPMRVDAIGNLRTMAHRRADMTNALNK